MLVLVLERGHADFERLFLHLLLQFVVRMHFVLGGCSFARAQQDVLFHKLVYHHANLSPGHVGFEHGHEVFHFGVFEMLEVPEDTHHGLLFVPARFLGILAFIAAIFVVGLAQDVVGAFGASALLDHSLFEERLEGVGGQIGVMAFSDLVECHDFED